MINPMSKKRKLETAAPDLPAGRTTSQRPLSAFEAARARSVQSIAGADAVVDIDGSEAPIFDQSAVDDARYITPEPANGQADDFSIQDNWRQMSTWTPSTENILHFDAVSYTLRMAHLERIANVGSFNIRVLKGKVTMCGAELSPQTPLQTVYACGTHPVPVIVCNSISGADITISNCPPPLQGLDALSPLFRGLWNWNEDLVVQTPTSNKRTFNRIENSRQDRLRRPLAPLVVSDEWDSALGDICPATGKAVDRTVIVAGMKRVGKSAFSKVLINRFLSTARNRANRTTGNLPAKEVPAAYVLDINPITTAFMVPGQISLLKVTELITSPPYATLSGQTVLKSLPLPEAATDDIDYYLDCISDLVSCYQTHSRARASRNSTLIIDTAPMSALGDGDFLTRLLQRIKPTHLVHLGPNPVEIKTDAFEKFQSQSQGSFYKLLGHTTAHVSRSDRQLQDMQLLSHFHQECGVENRRSWNITPLMTSQHISVSYSRKCPGFSGILLPSWAPSEYLTNIISGSILSVVYSEDPLLSASGGIIAISEPDELPYFQQTEKGQVQQLNPAHSHLVCLALVVNVDTEEQTINIIVPPTQSLHLQGLAAENIVLVHGCLATPTWAFKESIHLDQFDRLKKASRLGRGEESLETLGLVREQCQQAAKSIPWIETRDASTKAFWGNISVEVESDLPRMLA